MREAFRSERRRASDLVSPDSISHDLSREHSGSQLPGIITIFNFRVVKDCSGTLAILNLNPVAVVLRFGINSKILITGIWKFVTSKEALLHCSYRAETGLGK